MKINSKQDLSYFLQFVQWYLTMWLYNIFGYLENLLQITLPERETHLSLYIYKKKDRAALYLIFANPVFTCLSTDLLIYSCTRFTLTVQKEKLTCQWEAPCALLLAKHQFCSSPYVTPGRLGNSAHPTGPRNHWDSMKSGPPSLISSCVSTHSHTQQQRVT